MLLLVTFTVIVATVLWRRLMDSSLYYYRIDRDEFITEIITFVLDLATGGLIAWCILYYF